MANNNVKAAQTMKKVDTQSNVNTQNTLSSNGTTGNAYSNILTNALNTPVSVTANGITQTPALQKPVSAASEMEVKPMVLNKTNCKTIEKINY